jgi:OOP family OmpA-OmpF porin
MLGLAALFASSVQAANLPEKELGLLLGGSWVDSDMTGSKDDEVNPVIGIRYAQRLGTSTNFFSDLTYTDVDGNRLGVGDGAITTLRGGMEWLFAQQPGYNWFLAGGLGAIHVNTDDGPDFTRPLLSVGVGQAWAVGTNDAFRWEVRADQSFGNDSLPNSSLTNYQALLGYSWGIGAPVDTDGDGVPDRNDQCPGTPKGAKVDAKGCPLDSDGDGVYDGLDQCPGTPAGVKVDSRGCPLDSDGDGVTDDKDKCPTVYARTADGCPPPAPSPEPEPEPRKLILEGVNFDNDKATLHPEAIAILDQAAATLQEWGDVKVEVAGHTDSVASDAYNLQLSQRRANAVRDYLISKGIAAERLTAKGYGESMPIADNATEEGRFKNRRVELIPQK